MQVYEGNGPQITLFVPQGAGAHPMAYAAAPNLGQQVMMQQVTYQQPQYAGPPPGYATAPQQYQQQGQQAQAQVYPAGFNGASKQLY